MSGSAIEFRNVHYTYPDGSVALDDLSFAIEPGECVAVVGPSGAGKSTLALALVGFIFPQQGTISIDGAAVTPRTVREVRRKVGLIFQNADDQLFMPTLFDDVAFGPLQRGLVGKELEERVAKALADRGLHGLEAKFPGHLSGGQKRLAALAGVLAMEPQVLVLDEPSSNLDPRARRKLIGQLDSLQNTRLIAGHDLEMVLDICSRVLVMDGARLKAEGGPFEVLADAKLMEAHGLEVPHSLIPHRHDQVASFHSHTLEKARKKS